MAHCDSAIEWIGWIAVAALAVHWSYCLGHFVYTTYLGSWLGHNIDLSKCGPWAGNRRRDFFLFSVLILKTFFFMKKW